MALDCVATSNDNFAQTDGKRGSATGTAVAHEGQTKKEQKGGGGGGGGFRPARGRRGRERPRDEGAGSRRGLIHVRRRQHRRRLRGAPREAPSRLRRDGGRQGRGGREASEGGAGQEGQEGKERQEKKDKKKKKGKRRGGEEGEEEEDDEEEEGEEKKPKKARKEGKRVEERDGVVPSSSVAAVAAAIAAQTSASNANLGSMFHSTEDIKEQSAKSLFSCTGGRRF